MTSPSFSEMRRRNAGQILSIIRGHKELSRADLARLTGLAPATVSSIVDDFIQQGIFRESTRLGTGVGRKAIGLVFNPTAGLVIGASLESELISLCLCDLDGNVLSSVRGEWDLGMAPEQQAEKLSGLVAAQSAMDPVPGIGVGAIGLAVPGPISGSAQLPAAHDSSTRLDTTALLAALKHRFNLPLTLDSNTNAAAIAETSFGEAKGADCVLFVRVAHAVRSALIVKDQLIFGAERLAGDIGHVKIRGSNRLCHCGQQGCLDALVSFKGLSSRLKEMGMEVGSYPELIRMINSSNTQVHELLRESATALGQGVAPILNFIAPETLILSGFLSGSDFLEQFRASLAEASQPRQFNACRILAAHENDLAEATGAAIMASRYHPLLVSATGNHSSSSFIEIPHAVAL